MPKLEVVAARTDVWSQLREAAEAAARNEPHLASQMNAVILSHGDLSTALSFQIARKLGDAELGAMTVREVALSAFAADPGDRILTRLCTRLILVAHALRPRFASCRDAGKLTTIYNGVDLKRFRPCACSRCSMVIAASRASTWMRWSMRRSASASSPCNWARACPSARPTPS